MSGKDCSPRRAKRPRREEPAATNVAGSANPSSRRIRVAFIGTCLSEQSVDDLIGSLPAPHDHAVVHEQLSSIATFLRDHHLAVEVSGVATTSVITAASYYLPTMMRFVETQLDRQAVGLQTNVRKQSSAQDVTQLVNAHKAALQDALQKLCDQDSRESDLHFNKEQLCETHKTMCFGNEQRGAYRKTQVRAGTTLFPPTNRVESEMEKVFSSVESLFSRWMKPRDAAAERHNLDTVFRGIALSTIVLYSINTIHPFNDGNGRSSRLWCNYMLKKTLGLPFPVTLTATPQQREQYIDGLKKAQSHIVQLSSSRGGGGGGGGGGAPTGSSTSRIAPLGPLIHMLIDRIAHAVQQVQAAMEEKAQAASDEERSRILREDRERAAAGQCIICLDEHPNIATLCCGQALHLNCITQWLASNGTACVYCRRPLSQQAQPLQPEVQPPVLPQPEIEDSSTADSNDTSTTINASVEVDESSTATSIHDNGCIGQNCGHQRAQDCLNNMCGRCCVREGSALCVRHNTQTTEETSTASSADEDASNTIDETTTTSIEVDDASEVVEADETTTTPTICNGRSCSHRGALDCPNNMCGSCCPCEGSTRCVRHNTHMTTEDTTATSDDDEDTSSTTTVDETTTTEVDDTCCGPGCNNKSAQGCSNDMCGRCCPQLGVSSCPRH